MHETFLIVSNEQDLSLLLVMFCLFFCLFVLLSSVCILQFFFDYFFFFLTIHLFIFSSNCCTYMQLDEWTSGVFKKNLVFFPIFRHCFLKACKMVTLNFRKFCTISSAVLLKVFVTKWPLCGCVLKGMCLKIAPYLCVNSLQICILCCSYYCVAHLCSHNTHLKIRPV